MWCNGFIRSTPNCRIPMFTNWYPTCMFYLTCFGFIVGTPICRIPMLTNWYHTCMFGLTCFIFSYQGTGWDIASHSSPESRSIHGTAQWARMRSRGHNCHFWLFNPTSASIVFTAFSMSGSAGGTSAWECWPTGLAKPSELTAMSKASTWPFKSANSCFSPCSSSGHQELWLLNHDLNHFGIHQPIMMNSYVEVLIVMHEIDV